LNFVLKPNKLDQISCLIVDDEPLARELLVTYCSYLPHIRIEAVCGNAFEAKTILQEKPIAILFLDIHMPVLDGIGFLQTLKNKPQVIMTTAYKEYAVSAFDMAVCDYLVKPFPLERFIKAVDKAIENLNSGNAHTLTGKTEEDHVFIKAEGKIYMVTFKDLWFAEANGNYTKIVTTDKILLPAMPFSGLEQQLPTGQFIKVHRSFIINQSKIGRIEGNRIFINEQEIPVGKNYRDQLFKKLGL
jgi:DNA-binding LytR/AlgR family response regulator